MEWDPEQLGRVKRIELEALSEIKRICEKHRVRYYLDSGTLLGAVRHKGFIPWDDDIDVTMPWKDYRKFCRVCKHELNPRFFLQNYQTDHFSPPFAKLRVNGTTAMGMDEKNMNMHTGIWVDIFPLVGFKDEKQRDRMNRMQTWRILLVKDEFFRARNEALDTKMRMLYKLPLWLRRLMARCIEFYTCRDCNKTTYTAYYFPTLRRSFRTEWFQEPAQMMFEGELYDVPANWDAYLTAVYKDYMQLPPEDERKTIHHFLVVDCDRDYSYYRSLPDSAFPALQQ